MPTRALEQAREIGQRCGSPVGCEQLPFFIVSRSPHHAPALAERDRDADACPLRFDGGRDRRRGRVEVSLAGIGCWPQRVDRADSLRRHRLCQGLGILACLFWNRGGSDLLHVQAVLWRGLVLAHRHIECGLAHYRLGGIVFIRPSWWPLPYDPMVANGRFFAVRRLGRDHRVRRFSCSSARLSRGSNAPHRSADRV